MRRFSAASAALVGLFWAFAAWLHFGVDAPPRPQAVFRYLDPNWAADALWRYTGPRPAADEMLSVYARVGYFSQDDKTTVTLHLGPPGGPPDPQAWRKHRLGTPDYFTFGRVTVDSWPEDRDLFVGFQFRDRIGVDLLTFMEMGPWPTAPLENRPWARRLYNDPLTLFDKEVIGGLDVRIERRDRPGPPVSANSDSSITRYEPSTEHISLPVRWMAGWGLLWLTGLIFLPGKRMFWSVYNVFTGVLAWDLYGILHASAFHWGGHYSFRIGVSSYWIGLVAVQILTFPALGPAWRKVSSMGWLPILKFGNRGVILAFGILAALGLTWCSQQVPCRIMYGDGSLALQTVGYEGHNPLSMALYTLHDLYYDSAVGWLRSVLKLPPEWLPISGENGWSKVGLYLALFSPLYFLGTLGIAWRAGRNARERFCGWMILLSMKTLLLQFSYMEIYGPHLAVASVALWLVLVAWDRYRDVLLPSVAAFVTFLFHLGAMPLLPVVGLLWLDRGVRYGFRPSWLLSRTLCVTAICVFIWANMLWVLLALKYDYNIDEYLARVPKGGVGMLIGDSGKPAEVTFLRWDDPNRWHHYPLNSIKHLSQWSVGHMFLFGPISLLSILAAAAGFRRVLRSTMVFSFALSAMFFTVLSFFIFTVFPQPKDWDVFSLQSFVAGVLFLLLLYRARCLPPDLTRWTALAVILYQLWMTGGWLYYNLTWGPGIEVRDFILK